MAMRIVWVAAVVATLAAGGAALALAQEGASDVQPAGDDAAAAQSPAEESPAEGQPAENAPAEASAAEAAVEQPAAEDSAADPLTTGEFHWRIDGPLVGPVQREGDTCYSVKDPSVVFYDGKWRLFCTVRSLKRTHQIEYISFADWADADKAEHHVLTCHDGFFCAPQVFYFAPQKTWYMICQASDESWDPKYGAAYSTTETIADPGSWSPLKPLGQKRVGDKAGLDYWVICDDKKAHLFFTTLDGRLWREETLLADFPHGWSEPRLAIQDDIFEAAHIYRLKGRKEYLAIIEAQGGYGWRYYKAYTAARPTGVWSPLAATRQKAFASMANTRQPDDAHWTDCVSHGELLRDGVDQRLEVDPAGGLRMVFQGVLDRQRKGRPYGLIPWRLGLLTLEAPPAPKEPADTSAPEGGAEPPTQEGAAEAP